MGTGYLFASGDFNPPPPPPPVEVKPTPAPEPKPAPVAPPVAQVAAPAEAKPAEAAPAQANAAETKPGDVKPAEAAKPEETKPSEVKLAAVSPAEVKAAEVKTAEVKPAETKPEVKPAAAVAPASAFGHLVIAGMSGPVKVDHAGAHPSGGKVNLTLPKSDGKLTIHSNDGTWTIDVKYKADANGLTASIDSSPMALIGAGGQMATHLDVPVSRSPMKVDFNGGAAGSYSLLLQYVR